MPTPLGFLYKRLSEKLWSRPVMFSRPAVGTSADIFAAVWFARQDRMGLVISICIGSGVRVAPVAAPLIFSWIAGHPMTPVLRDPIGLFSIAGTALIVNATAGDGETAWFEGVLLIGVYLRSGPGVLAVMIAPGTDHLVIIRTTPDRIPIVQRWLARLRRDVHQSEPSLPVISE